MNWTTTIWDACFQSSPWMSWNLLLAWIPLALSLWLFRRAHRRSLLWWMGVFCFIAFLPNAPYILTDLLHLVEELQATDSRLIGTLVIIPKYVVFVGLGIEAYVLSLIYLGNYLKRQGLGACVLQTELVLHALCAIGIYLGRFERLNSWDLVTRLHRVVREVAQNLQDGRPLFFILIGFVMITAIYWLLKQVTLAVMLQRQYLIALQRIGQRSDLSDLSQSL